MIVVHHLNDSRSQRILWLLEELELPYEIKAYQRDATTRLAPPELTAVHPLGKSPVVTEDGATIAESGAIIDYILRHHGAGRLAPPVGTPDHEAHQQWLHYAEGSAMLPLMLNMYVARLGEAGAPLHPRIQGEIANHLGYVDSALAGRDYLMGSELSAADIQMSFVGEVAGAFGLFETYPNVAAWVRRFQARPAYRKALAKGGPYNLGPKD
ncbi:glutathione S-transferase [Phenylobacterium sp. Root77]|uniref:glutathione S-transferase family protein n=1 Tax=unclassified Phenylobacterium TaxID=2640670 RepID=UPI0006FD7A4A|nr:MULTISPECIES: glutathione S-transferase [unclassified Phenylobacterium]KQW73394.1 glutathione S-transferase [Phenylobacterium sp. Root1277]KQW92613.1 glutathione S-transferase [Phenylobacterium sp. Root1290]KRC40841.1 glutathione S-transferase [Phenylobacterium sp. Root77]